MRSLWKAREDWKWNTPTPHIVKKAGGGGGVETWEKNGSAFGDLDEGGENGVGTGREGDVN